MKNKKDTTRILLGESLQTLMLQYPFDKITIKMIADEAGVIRPTFYNYFQDKYELLEWIFITDIVDKVKDMTDAGMEKEGIKLFFRLIEKDKAFYRKAITITGQNSFETVLRNHIYELFYDKIIRSPHKASMEIKLLTSESMALYYSQGLVNIVKFWLTPGNDSASSDDIMEAYFYMLSHSIFDILE